MKKLTVLLLVIFFASICGGDAEGPMHDYTAFIGLEVGSLTDTTTTRDKAGKLAVEGKQIASGTATDGSLLVGDGTDWQVQSKRVFDVRDYGATGDGVTDDTTAIQSAINDVNAVNGGTVYLPDGKVYGISATLTLGNNVRLTGGGELLLLSIPAGGAMVKAESKSNVVIEGITFNGSGLLATMGVVLKSCTNATVSNCIIYNGNPTGTDYSAIRGHRNNGNKYTYNHIYNWGDGIFGAVGATRAADFIDSNSVIAYNYIHDCTVGSAIGGVFHSSKIVGNICADNAHSGIDIIGYATGSWCKDVLVSENICFNNTYRGIRNDLENSSAFCERITIAKNHVFSNGSGGIVVDGARGYNVTGNIVVNNTGSGIASNNIRNSKIENNLIYDDLVTAVMTYGILMQSTAGTETIANVVVGNNKVDGCVWSGIHIEADGAGTSMANVVVKSNNVYDCGYLGIGLLVTGGATSSHLNLSGNRSHGQTYDMRANGLDVYLADNDFISPHSSMLHWHFTPQDTTPSVLGGRTCFRTANTSATTITNFDDAKQGRVIYVWVHDADTTFGFSGSYLKGNGELNVLAPANSVWMFKCEGTFWTCVNNEGNFNAIELGHATDNTLSASGGELSIEGVQLAKLDGGLQDLDTLGAAAADGEIIVATGAGALAWEKDATARTSLGVGTGDSPQLTGVNVGHADDNTLTRIEAGVLGVEAHVRSTTSTYVRLHHVGLYGASPGASGATFVPPDANRTGGWQLNAATEYVYGESVIHGDWDGATDLTLEVHFTINTDNTGGAGTDTCDGVVEFYYKGDGEDECKRQTVEGAKVIGAASQYTQFSIDIPLNWDLADNVVQAGDIMGLRFNLETDTSEVDDVTITNISLRYSTSHLGMEDGDF